MTAALDDVEEEKPVQCQVWGPVPYVHQAPEEHPCNLQRLHQSRMPGYEYPILRVWHGQGSQCDS